MAITFQRTLSTVIQTILADAGRTYNTEIAVEFALGNGSFLYYATKGLVMDTLSQGTSSVSITPVTFVSRLEGTPELRHSQAKAPDAGEFEIVNLDYVISASIPTVGKPWDNTFCTVYLCFPKANGNYEGLVYFVGALANLTGDDEKAGASVISDLAMKGSYVGAEMTQRCTNTFQDAWCGVNNVPGGSTCSLVYHDKVNGCLYWGGQFKGVPFINPNGIAVGSNGTGNGDDGTGGGWGHGHHCLDLDTTWYPSANGGDIHARDMKPGEVILNHFDQAATVQHVENFMAPYRYGIETHFGASVISSATHRLLRAANDDIGRAAMDVVSQGDDILVKLHKRLRLARQTDTRSDYRTVIAPPGMVQEITVTGVHTYLAGRQRGKWIANHNKELDPFYIPIFL